MGKHIMPRLKYRNGYHLVVMGVELPITAVQARTLFSQLQQWREVAHG